MSGYIVKRILNSIVVLVVVAILSFLLFNVVPGDPAVDALGPNITPKSLSQMRTQMGLNRPTEVRFLIWSKQMANLELGVSFRFGANVSDIIKQTLPYTMALTGGALAMAILLATILAVITSVRKNSFIDRFLSGVAMLGMSVPDFWIASMLILVCGRRLELLDFVGKGGNVYTTLEGRLKGYLFPFIMLTLMYLGMVFRYIKSSVQETLTMDYIRSARSRGVKEITILYKHMLKNAIIPVITFAGYTIPAMISSSMILEILFKYPGIGRVMYEANMGRDYTMLMGCLLVIATMVVVCSLVADLLYTLVDPRIQYH